MKKVPLAAAGSERDTRDFFKVILDRINLGGLFVDRGRVIRYCNEVVKAIFGYSQEEITGKQTDLLYGDRRQNPFDKDEIYNRLETNGFHVGRARGLTKSGEAIDLTLSTFLVKPQRGAIVLIEEAKAEEVGRVNKERFLQALLDTIPDMIYCKDARNRFLLVNKAHAAALGLSPERVAGRTDFDFFPRELAERYYSDDNYVMRTGNPIVGKIERAPRQDGGITYVSTTKVPYYDEKGNVIGTIGITRNITDKMIAEEELRRHKDQLEELVRERTHELEESREKLLKMYTVKSEFTSMVSHELRTPLAIIKEAVSIVEDEIEGPLGPKQKEYLHIASQNIERLARLINDILDFSKLEGKKMEFKIVEGDLNGLIRQVLKSYEGIIEKKGLGLRANLDPSLPLVGLDEDRIVQVLHNLFDNAIKFTERGWIAVGSRTVGNGLEVSVEDTGCGIRGEDLHRVFEKFEQLVPEGQKKKNGTGLGLAICKQIIEQLGGRIFVESEYGKGSKFFFTLPTRGARANEGER